MTQEEKYMKEAIKQAKKAAAIGDVPIGCVIVENDKIIARAYNQRNKKKMIGDWKIVPCISHWNHARCAQELSYRHEFPKL